MTVRDQVLQLLERNRGVYFSGEELAKHLAVSRAAVWKAVKALRSEGYSIDAVNNKGYCLSEDTDILSAQGIRKYLDPELSFLQLQVLEETASTNADVREKAGTGAPEGTCVLARQQRAGRGRYGRNFYSPADTGLYLSILLRPEGQTAQQALSVTTMAAAAMCLAIERVSGKKPGIKWVNDILIDGKKVCGILTEGSFSMENGSLESAVLGVGLNLYPPKEGFPKELQDIAGSVFESPCRDMKNRMTAEFLNAFFRYYRRGSSSGYAEKYRESSLIIGKTVTVRSAAGEYSALVLGIDDACRLRIRHSTGEEQILSYGEISVKL